MKDAETNSYDIKQMREKTGLSQQKFGDMFQIPVSNIRNWEQGVAKPPKYVPYMIAEIINLKMNKICPESCADMR